MPLTPEELAHVVTEYQAQCDSGHQRLRTDFRMFHDHTEMAFATMRSRMDLLENKHETLAQTPPDAMKLRFSTGVIVSIVAVTISIVSTGATVGVKVTNRIDALAVDMARQSEDDKKERAILAKLSDERNARQEKAIDTLARQVELLKYEQQRLREDVTGKGVKR